MQNIEILGLIAAVCTTSAFVPQVFKIWKHKSTKDISLVMYLVFLAGTTLWFIYGLHYESVSMILANGITSALIVLVIGLKLKYK
ncbi:SemiSWEET transporter [uncultured Kriegella sp.]|uniref:SemiSWEET family sugar transporter n=1 Tax=uncultured Kriegella sp. TaxID=1798910 RepID=UPI0030DA5D91|tara:strand:- start:10539 stop:10793 length:255 start_codon:yes stop_codon:yes gene_type:complete